MEQKEKKRLTAGRTRALKLALDAVMLILLTLMYQKQVVSLSFHEIGGLALIGLFVIHHLVNARWIAAVTRKLFGKTTPGLVRARYLVDALMLAAFLTVGVTGVLISKTLFAVRLAGNAKTLHYFASAVAIILMGVHLGLHTGYLFGKLFKRGANRIAKISTAVLLAALIAFGGYSLATTRFVSFLAAPFQSARFAHGTFEASGDAASDGSSVERPGGLSELPELAQGDEEPQQDDGAQPPQDGGNGLQRGGQGVDADGGQGRGEGARNGQGEGGARAALLIAQYAGIIALFGVATHGVVVLTGRRKRKPKESLPVPADTNE